jgi:hypothetical protein
MDLTRFESNQTGHCSHGPACQRPIPPLSRPPPASASGAPLPAARTLSLLRTTLYLATPSPHPRGAPIPDPIALAAARASKSIERRRHPFLFPALLFSSHRDENKAPTAPHRLLSTPVPKFAIDGARVDAATTAITPSR